MTHPPTRADQVRMMSTQASRKQPPGASMTAIDLDDDNVRPDAWFVYVMPVQSGVELIGSGRYGYWSEQPDVKLQDDCVVITSKGEDEPIFIAPRASAITVHVAQAKHIEATPFPVAQVQPQSAA
jgi:hypothetical protein